MRIEGDRLIYELTECFTCDGTGLVYGRVRCQRCGGSGNGPRGGRGGCRACSGFGSVPDRSRRTLRCRRCDGSGRVPEDRYSYIRSHLMDEILNRVPIVVARRDRAGTWNEAFLGIGCVYSVTDYGRSAELSDAELIAQVRERIARGTQACKVVDDEDRLPAAIVIAAHRNGYSVRAQHGTESVVPLGEPQDVARARGMSVYEAGGHGTLAAALEVFE
jgi:hypothetical protein